LRDFVALPRLACDKVNALPPGAYVEATETVAQAPRFLRHLIDKWRHVLDKQRQNAWADHQEDAAIFVVCKLQKEKSLPAIRRETLHFAKILGSGKQ
jgi:hypothetical protein